MISKKHLPRTINLIVDSILDHSSETRFAFFDLSLGAWKKGDLKTGKSRFLRLGFRRKGRTEIFLSESDIWQKVVESREEFVKVHEVLPGTDYSGALEGIIKKRTAALMKSVNPEAKRSEFEVRIDPLRYEFPCLLNFPTERYSFDSSGETFRICSPRELKIAAAQ